MEKIKKVTIDDLAIMINKGFKGVDEKFKGVDERFEKIEKDIRGVKEDVKGVKEDVKGTKEDIRGIKEGVREVVMDSLAKFNVDFLEKGLEKTEERLKVEIKKSEQAGRDWTDKKVRESEGKIISKINTLTNVLEEKDVINAKEAGMVKRAGVGV